MFEPIEIVALAVSTVALAVSGLTLWFTQLRRGEVKMTQPTQIYFGSEIHNPEVKKVYVRSLLYSTGTRGWLVEQLYVRLSRGETSQNFPIWVSGEDRLSRGCGLQVGPSGIVANHHFLLPPDGTEYDFLPGSYQVEIFASVVNKSNSVLLNKVEVKLTDQNAKLLKQSGTGIHFDWGPDQGEYIPHSKDIHSLFDDQGKPIMDDLVARIMANKDNPKKS